MTINTSLYKILTEDKIEWFRETFLTPDSMLLMLGENRVLLIVLPVGVGKSTAIDRLLRHPELFQRFQRVIYCAPSWGIINSRNLLGLSVESVKILGRGEIGCPDEQETAWRVYEKTDSYDRGKRDICRKCLLRKTCQYPKRLSKKIGTASVVLLTEQRITQDPDLVPRISKLPGQNGGCLPTVLIMDEAQMMNGKFAQILIQSQLLVFRSVLQDPQLQQEIEGKDPMVKISPWIYGITQLLEIPKNDVQELELSFHGRLNRHAALIEDYGIKRFSKKFRYVGYQLVNLGRSNRDERWKDEEGTISFRVRPSLGDHAFMLGANLSKDLIAHKMRITGIESPFETFRFEHSESEIWNLRSSLGGAVNFKGNKRQILDFIAVLLFRNIHAGKPTMLVAKMATKKECADYLLKRLKGWEIEVSFITNPSEYPALEGKDPQPSVIPMIHYGIAGVNYFERYVACYACNSFNLSTGDLTEIFFDGEPGEFGDIERLKTGKDPDRYRTAFVNSEDPEEIARAERLILQVETNIADQTLGRSRYKTTKTEVGFFQSQNLEVLFGRKIREFDNIEEASRGLGIPRASELDTVFLAEKLQRGLDKGLSQKKAAEFAGTYPGKVTKLKQEGKIMKKRPKNGNNLTNPGPQIENPRNPEISVIL